MDINFDEYDLIPITKISNVSSPIDETLYNLTIDSFDHAFYINLPQSDKKILVHNCDGSHITSMLIGWFKRFAPHLFKEGKICKLITPLIIVHGKDDTIKEFFFNVDDFKKWEKSHPGNKLKYTYLKGLASWEKNWLNYLIDTYGIERFILTYRLDDEGNTLIEDWLGEDSDKRKKHLSNYVFDIDAV